MQHYLITDKETGKKHIAKASQRSLALADAAGDRYECEAISEGVASTITSDDIPIREVSKARG